MLHWVPYLPPVIRLSCSTEATLIIWPSTQKNRPVMFYLADGENQKPECLQSVLHKYIEHNTCLMLQYPAICWTRQPSTDLRAFQDDRHSKSLHVTWERPAHFGLIWSNIMSQAVSWLRRELDLQMSGWHQSQYPHRIAHKCMANCARTPCICIYINRRLYNQLFSPWAIFPCTQYRTHAGTPSN